MIRATVVGAIPEFDVYCFEVSLQTIRGYTKIKKSDFFQRVLAGVKLCFREICVYVNFEHEVLNTITHFREALNSSWLQSRCHVSFC